MDHVWTAVCRRVGGGKREGNAGLLSLVDGTDGCSRPFWTPPPLALARVTLASDWVERELLTGIREAAASPRPVRLLLNQLVAHRVG